MAPATPRISLVVAALSPGLGIGAKGSLPWRLKHEMKYFKDVTSKCRDGHVNAVIMGRKTWESIAQRFRPLPNRLNVVLSSSYSNTTENGVLFLNSLDYALQQLQDPGFAHGTKKIDKIFVIGGAKLYNTLFGDPRVENLLVTNVRYVGPEASTPVLDTFLEWDSSEWEKQPVTDLRRFVEIDFAEGEISEGDYVYEYTMWQRKK